MGLLSNFTIKAAAITSAIIAAIFVAAVAYGLHSWSVASLNKAHDKALTAQKTALILDCTSDKSITEGIDNAIYLNHANIDGVLNDRLLNYTGPGCLAITGETSGPTTPVAGKGVVHKTDGQSNGVSRAELYRIAAEGDKVLADLYECRAFIDETWKAKGQLQKTPR